MAYPKYAGMNGKMDQKNMRQQQRQTSRQDTLKISDLPQTVSEEGEYDDEPGGVRLNGALFSMNSGQLKGKAPSELNPTSSPWLPKTNGINKVCRILTSIQHLEGRTRLKSSSGP